MCARYSMQHATYNATYAMERPISMIEPFMHGLDRATASPFTLPPLRLNDRSACLPAHGAATRSSRRSCATGRRSISERSVKAASATSRTSATPKSLRSALAPPAQRCCSAACNMPRAIHHASSHVALSVQRPQRRQLPGLPELRCASKCNMGSAPIYRHAFDDGRISRWRRA